MGYSRLGQDGSWSNLTLQQLTQSGWSERFVWPAIGSIVPTARRFWAPTSPINELIPDNPALDQYSSQISSLLGASASALSIIAFGTTIYYATTDTPRFPTGPTGSGPGVMEIEMIGQWGPNPLQGLTVPMDPSWVGAPGYPDEPYRDGAAVVVDTDGRIFSFFQLVNGTTPKANWAGWTWGRETDTLITDVAGAGTGSGFSRLAGIIRRDELAAGSIDHALVFASKYIRPTEVKAPAKKTDGSYLVGGTATLQNSIPEAQRVQLNPSVNLDAIPGITQIELMVGRALQKYGAYAIDNGGGAPMHFICETPEPSGYTYNGNYSFTMHDPTYLSIGVTREGPSLARIPWNQIRVLQ